MLVFYSDEIDERVSVKVKKAKKNLFLVESLCGFCAVVALWIAVIDSGFIVGMEMISRGFEIGYLIVFGIILSSVGIWGLFQLLLKLVFPDAYEESISFYRFHLICGGIGCVLCTLFFIDYNPLFAFICPFPLLVSSYLYRKKLRFEQFECC
ncbi:hypothetical protein Q4567_19075 [Aliiglaciecola sp. 2_MG-2023]|uniref:hypothetical protein n=1 Tax=Alteromonadaceae TaxID=72275 RepID=UPI0026E14979|nr:MULTISPECIES: hypothetical protein [unclassified Aliiglaciecola]MDO6712844.1 hypothetical protein [Aliiglaciecola sp. 2_MG-2023]MDO6753939.1 hypothetical protein [Aliiglaciecola sp. 1_MG-2023]